MLDCLSGEDAPKLHLVSHHGCQELQSSLASLASSTNGHYHSVHIASNTQAEEVSAGTFNVHPLTRTERF